MEVKPNANKNKLSVFLFIASKTWANNATVALVHDPTKAIHLANVALRFPVMWVNCNQQRPIFFFRATDRF